MKTGYYIVKFYNHEERKVFYFNGNSFESFKSDPFIHDEIESTEPLNIQSHSPSLSAEQEAMEYADNKVNKDGTSHAYTGQQVFEMLTAAYLAGKASGGDGIQPKQIFIHNTIEGCVDEIQTIEDAKAYVKDWYVEGESMHPDFYSFDILQKVGEVYAEIVGDVCLGLHVKTDNPSSH